MENGTTFVVWKWNVFWLFLNVLPIPRNDKQFSIKIFPELYHIDTYTLRKLQFHTRSHIIVDNISIKKKSKISISKTCAVCANNKCFPKDLINLNGYILRNPIPLNVPRFNLKTRCAATQYMKKANEIQ